LRFDWLSLSPRCWDNRERLDHEIPGALEHSLFSHPVERFMALWPRVLDLHAKRTLRITVLGGSTQGAELAFAIKRRLPQSALTWLTLGAAPAEADLQSLALERALQTNDITVLHDRALSIAQGSVQLACGATLASDVPIIAQALDAPTWLRNSGVVPPASTETTAPPLAELVDAWSRCTGHPQVFWPLRPMLRWGTTWLPACSADLYAPAPAKQAVACTGFGVHREAHCSGPPALARHL